jgi:hypothetical protein
MTGLTVPHQALPVTEQEHPPLEIPEFRIVPRVGLAISGILVALLIAAIAVDTKWPLDFFHVAGGAAWTIVDLFMGLIIGPILGRLSPPARVELTTRLMPKMLVIMPTVVTLTLAAGWQLGIKDGTVFSGDPSHPWVVASFIVVGVMAVLALGLLEPANIAVLFELKRPRPRPEVIERLMKRFVYCSGILGLMQIATLVIMTHIASS